MAKSEERNLPVSTLLMAGLSALASKLYPRREFSDRFRLRMRETILAHVALVSGSRQPNHDIHARCSEISAACVKGFPAAAIQHAAEALADAAVSTKGSEVQLATLVKSGPASGGTRPTGPKPALKLMLHPTAARSEIENRCIWIE